MTTSGVSHSKVSAIGDGGDSSLVRPSDWNDDHVISYVKPAGLTGATAASRYVGATTQGAPTSGTFAVGDFVIDQSGFILICKTAGSPGTWVAIGKPGLDRVSFNTTFGDDFNESSLNARWSNHNLTGGQETFQVGGRASAIQIAHGATNAAEYIYQTAPNNTNETWEASFSLYNGTSTGQMWGIIMVNSSGTGCAALVYDNGQGYYLTALTSHTFSTTLATGSFQSTPSSYYYNGGRMWMKLRKATGAYSVSVSMDGEVYSKEVTASPSAFTPARIGIGRYLGTSSGSIFNIHWFDKTA